MEVKPESLANSNKNTINNSSETAMPKKPKRKFMRYILLLIVIVALLVGGYFKFNHLLPNFSNKSMSMVGDLQPSTANELGDYLQQLKNWQADINQKVDNLSQYNSKGVDYDTSKKIDGLKEQLNKLAKQTNQQNIINNFQISLRFIAAITTNKPFVEELAAFKNTAAAKNYNEQFAIINNFAEKGVLTNIELNNQLNNLEKTISVQAYKANQSTWGKIKYYLSYLIVINKYKNFTNKDDESLSYNLYKLHDFISNNQLNSALDLLADPQFNQINGLTSWKNELVARNVLNQVIISLTQYLLNYAPVE